MFPPLVKCSSQPRRRTARRVVRCRSSVRVRACERASVAQCACRCRRAGMGAPCNALQAGRKNGRPKRGREPRTRERRSARALRPPRTVGAAYEVLQTGGGAVCVLWCRKDEEQRERCVRRCVRSNIVPTWRSCASAGCGCACERVRWCWWRYARMCVLMPKQRRTATWMSRRTRAVIHYPRSGGWCESATAPACRWRVSQTASFRAVSYWSSLCGIRRTRTRSCECHLTVVL